MHSGRNVTRAVCMRRLARTGQSVGLPWGGPEDYTLKRAVERARAGVAFLYVKDDASRPAPGPGPAANAPASGPPEVGKGGTSKAKGRPV